MDMKQEADAKVNANMAHTARIEAEYKLPTQVAVMAVAIGNILAASETAIAIGKALVVEGDKLAPEQAAELLAASAEATGGLGESVKDNVEALTKAIFGNLLEGGNVKAPVSLALAIRDILGARMNTLNEALEEARAKKGGASG